jgi:hypothetical protein
VKRLSKSKKWSKAATKRGREGERERERERERSKVLVKV